ncbi:MAG: preprotein translocase subunit SecG [Gammaproteobacteria bacterium]|jgi:preprotein translocase subunit SecG
MFTFLLVVQILVSLSIISLVMLQQGKGADMGAGFGAGASGTVFGARGSGSFFTKATGILAAVFFINCLLIASPLIRESSRPGDSLADRLEQQAVQQQSADEQAQPVEELEQPATGQSQTETGEAADAADPSAEADSDLPEVPAAPPPEPSADDLPE